MRYFAAIGCIFFVATVSMVGTGCGPTVRGSGNIETVEHEVSDLQKLSVCCGFKVQFREGDSSSIAITGDDNIIDEIEVTDRGDVIEVAYEDRTTNYRPTQRIIVDATLTNLQRFNGSGGVRLSAAPIESESLVVNLSGGSRANFTEFIGQDFELTASGGSQVEVSGEVERQVVEMSGGGRYQAAGLASQTAWLQLSGGVRATLQVSFDLDVEASGGSEVTYYGDPTVEAETSGGSSVRRADE